MANTEPGTEDLVRLSEKRTSSDSSQHVSPVRLAGSSHTRAPVLPMSVRTSLRAGFRSEFANLTASDRWAGDSPFRSCQPTAAAEDEASRR